EQREEVAPPSGLQALGATGRAAGPVVVRAAVAVRLRLRLRLRFGTAAPVRGLTGLNLERVVLAHERARRRVLKVAAPPGHLLLLLGALPYGLLVPLAARLPAGEALLGFLQPLLGFLRVARSRDTLPVRREEQPLQPHVSARLTHGR